MKKLEQTLTESETVLHRRDDCGNYDSCLDKAAVQRWRSFSCIECGDYKKDSNLTLRIRKSSSLVGGTF